MIDDLEPLLSAVSPDAPSGPDLEYDPEFSRMEKSAQGTPDQQFGSTVIEAQPPDWESVRAAAVGLLKRTKDLRIGAYLAEAELVLRGLEGFRDGLQLLASYIKDFWETTFPLLDADDDNDPTSRVNALLRLSNAGSVLRTLRSTIILSSRTVGRFSWTDVAIAKGEIPPPAGMEEIPTLKKIDAAVQNCDIRELERFAQAVDEGLRFTADIEGKFSDELGAASGPNFEPLIKELKNISKLLKGWLSQRQEDDPSPKVETATSTGAASEAAATQSTGPLVVGGEFVISKRQDAIEGLDKIIRWFEKNEPSSPLPMLLKRAKRLSSMSFIDILKDISPDAVNQAVVVGGQDATEDTAKQEAARLKAQEAAAKSSRSASAPPPRDDKY